MNAGTPKVRGAVESAATNPIRWEKNGIPFAIKNESKRSETLMVNH
eukprot:CAMPEP_0171528266 /NCGR_PEP_ID=MMETSP0959-20130129/11552_1 /TAXON_ID=87120 /ORGANISM="Aurantiochytrium limacinum, Strain ATCCMYA-1381" /LENGTH=45 /DNA_ID= /DNA_START= /DNA_END= /DNA_ORIENTATION=